jgi:hypothetical protein
MGGLVDQLKPPEFILADPSAFRAYQEVSRVMGSKELSTEQKQEQIRVLQRTLGEELVVTVIRYVPVYDPAVGTYVTFDEYMRDFAKQYTGQVVPGSPLYHDPVGAAARIFLSPDVPTMLVTIAQMSGVGMSEEERQQAYQQYLEENEKREARNQKRIEAWQQALERKRQQASDAIATVQTGAATTVPGIIATSISEVQTVVPKAVATAHSDIATAVPSLATAVRGGIEDIATRIPKIEPPKIELPQIELPKFENPFKK